MSGSMTSMRSLLCGEATAKQVGEELVLCGWVAARRDHGGVIFIDLRDHTGLVQVVCEPAQEQAFAIGEQLRPEHVVQVCGAARRRPADTVNPKLPTGEIEVLAAAIEHLNPARTPAFLPDDDEAGEETRLANRVLHLRSRAMQRALRLRHRMLRAARRELEGRGFIEVETPMLTLATPEGARDFLVPARAQPGSFYALPQSPQLFKQMLMAGGVDRYYQIARCFRDEDLRAGRQPEFTQIDVEMAFAEAGDVMEAGEAVARAAFAAGGAELGEVPRLSYAEALRRFGSDAPHLGIELELVDVKDLVADCGFKVFAAPAAQDGSRVVALPVPDGARLSRKQIDDLTEFARKLGAGGLAWLKVDEPGRGAAGVSSPIAKFLGDAAVDAIVARAAARAGDLVFFGAGPARAVNAYMGPVRERLGADLGIVKPGLWPAWITGFPLFERGEDGALASMHHPFTAPLPADRDALLAGERLDELGSEAYDLVANGVELGGGSLRIHQAGLQLAALRALGIAEEEARRKFGFLLDALELGAPPHGGLAYGFDRMAAMAAGAASIRDVIAFPKTQRGQCPFTQAPQPVDDDALRELGLRPGPAKA